MDSINRDILASLKANSRIAWSDLANKVGISRAALRSRIERMEKKGVILGYTITTSHQADRRLPNEPEIKALLHIKFSGCGSNDCFKLSSHLKSYKNVLASWGVTGAWDMFVLVKGGTMEAISETREIIKATGGVSRIETSVVLNELKSNS